MEGNATGRARAVGQDGNVQPLVVSSATTLGPDDTYVIATIPLASANDYTITLPATASAEGREFFILGKRATGSYVDGEVTVAAPSDGVRATTIVADNLSATGDYKRIENVRGVFYDEISEVTT